MIKYTEGEILTEKEAIQRARWLYTDLKQSGEWMGDVWFGLSDNWDVNIWDDNFTGRGKKHVTIYRVVGGEVDTSWSIRVMN